VVTDIGRRNGVRQLWLEIQNVNIAAVRAYRALGFQLVGLDTSLYDGDVAHETAFTLHGQSEAPTNCPDLLGPQPASTDGVSRCVSVPRN